MLFNRSYYFLFLIMFSMLTQVLNIKQGKGNKDRCLPMALKATYLFIGRLQRQCLLPPGAQWAIIAQAVKKAGIAKEVSLHTLRHTYTTRLLEQGVNILTVKELYRTCTYRDTMVYLHLARPLCGPCL